MATLLVSEASTRVLEELQANVRTFNLSSTTANSTTLTVAVANLVAGMEVGGTGIVERTKIASVGATTVTLDTAATDSTTATRTFSVDPPVTIGAGSEMERHLNDAYAFLWENAGGSIKSVPSATAWTAAQLATGTAFGILTDVNEVLHVYGTTTAPATVSCNTSTSVNVVAASGSFVTSGITAGMEVSGSGVVARTRVASVTDATNLVLDTATTSTVTPTTLTFSPTSGSIELRRVELSRIRWLRANTGFGTYAAPQEYALYRAFPSVAGNVNKLVLEYWPSTTGYYFPMEYVGQFVPVTTTTESFDLNDLQSRDLVYLTAISIAPLIGRAEFVPKVAAKLSEGTRLALERKQSAMLNAKQDQ